MKRNVPLSEHTTLGVGGPAAHWCEAHDAGEIRRALEWADQRSVPVVVLGAGSNVLVADAGMDALVLRVRIDMLEVQESGGYARVEVGAGRNWDELTAWAVARDYAGVECLGGIPGEVGAAPIQNVGAYGQEVSGTITHVRAIGTSSGQEIELDAEECDFSYRDSGFKRELDRWVITAVRFRFAIGGAPTIAYGELENALAGKQPSLSQVRDTVIGLRRRKSMVLDPADPNHRSAGSFFVNPTVSAAQAEEVTERAARVCPGQTMPQFPVNGAVKLSAAWLIERSGLPKGTTRGPVGLSSNHCLAIINRGGATAFDILAFAVEIRARVRDTFGVSLTPEPRLLGFSEAALSSLRD